MLKNAIPKKLELKLFRENLIKNLMEIRLLPKKKINKATEPEKFVRSIGRAHKKCLSKINFEGSDTRISAQVYL